MATMVMMMMVMVIAVCQSLSYDYPCCHSRQSSSNANPGPFFPYHHCGLSGWSHHNLFMDVDRGVGVGVGRGVGVAGGGVSLLGRKRLDWRRVGDLLGWVCWVGIARLVIPPC